MKKLHLILPALILFIQARSQDTILWEDFEDEYIGITYDGGTTGNYYEGYPLVVFGDTNWCNYDNDGFADASGTNRPLAWDVVYGFADTDSSTIVAFSNSWTSPATPVSNYLITPSLQITDTSARLSWKSAPYQTPLYLDGYVVLVSTGDNDINSFTDTLFVAAEYISNTDTAETGVYSLYTFSGGFVHGQDGQYVEPDVNDHQRSLGVLKPFSVSLAAYDNQQIYIAFLHNSEDDNLISLDDILVTEISDPTFSTENQNIFHASVFPNPTADYINLSYPQEYENVRVIITDSKGSTVYSGPAQASISIDVRNFSGGMYTLQLVHAEGTMMTKISVTH